MSRTLLGWVVIVVVVVAVLVITVMIVVTTGVVTDVFAGFRLMPNTTAQAMAMHRAMIPMATTAA
jgi:hypothetical protein